MNEPELPSSDDRLPGDPLAPSGTPGPTGVRKLGESPDTAQPPDGRVAVAVRLFEPEPVDAPAAAPTDGDSRAETDTAAPPLGRPVVGPARRGRFPLIAEGALLGLAGLVTLVSVGVRFVGPRGLWLDETLTVNISKLPLPKLFDALRHDGSPPAYYLLLHFWMRLFGTGTWTVRSLAGLISVLTLPAAWALGRALGGRRLAAAAVVVMACNPFALRYATENRMYSLVVLLTTVGALLVVRCLQRPTFVRMFLLGLATGLLLLTHYWALYVVAAAGSALALTALWGPVRGRARATLAALCSGGLLFVPWVPSFLFQAAHTGTPWATAASPMMIIEALGEFAGWEQPSGIALFVVFLAMMAVVALAVILMAPRITRPLAGVLGWRRPVPGSRWATPVAGVALLAMVYAMVGGMLSGAAFAYRYASVVLPLVVLLVAMGIVAVSRSRLGLVTGAATLVAVAVLGTTAGAAGVLGARTQATVVAAEIRAAARPGDVIAYCPDQLGPAVSRLLPDRVYTQVTFPRWDPPDRINWVDYAQVNGSANVGVFARELLNLAGHHQVWLVWEAGYRTLGFDCQELRDTLELARPVYSEPIQSDPGRYYEHESLMRFAPA